MSTKIESRVVSGERIVEANGVELCVESFGDAADPAVLLVHGASASMLWWERELCERIVAGGRHVVRFDNRPDPSDPEAVVEFIVGLMKVYSGSSPHFDEQTTRRLAERDLARTRNVASCLTNHFVIDTGGSNWHRLEQIVAATLVVHGERDPVFPLAHGQPLRNAIPNAELLVLKDTGHELPPPLWHVFVPALLRHTTEHRPAAT